jgi:hypothetical protein
MEGTNCPKYQDSDSWVEAGRKVYKLPEKLRATALNKSACTVAPNANNVAELKNVACILVESMIEVELIDLAILHDGVQLPP